MQASGGWQPDLSVTQGLLKIQLQSCASDGGMDGSVDAAEGRRVCNDIIQVARRVLHTSLIAYDYDGHTLCTLARACQSCSVLIPSQEQWRVSGLRKQGTMHQLVRVGALFAATWQHAC